jgi:hypothetical protein
MKIKNIESGHKIVGDFVLVPLYDIITPKHNRIVMTERWWALTSNDEVLFYKYYGRFYSSPQCNSNFKIVEQICSTCCYGNYDGLLIPYYIKTAYIPSIDE